MERFFISKAMTLKSTFIVLLLVWSPSLLARKATQPPFEDPFDTGSGGASLTRATQEGMLFNNPAQLAYGGKTFRWVGLKAIAGGDINAIQNLNASAGEGESSGEEGAKDLSTLVTQFNESPIHAVIGTSFSLITDKFGLGVFTHAEPDFKTYPAGNVDLGIGVPSAVVSSEIYAGAIMAFASRSPWKFLSFGLSGKYLIAEDNQIATQLTGTDALESAQAQLNEITARVQNPSGLSTGVGGDASMLMFFQGNWLDYRIAAVAENIGGLAFTGDNAAETFPQMIHVGTSLTLHTRADAIHMAVDLRDATSETNEPMFKKVYAGTKILLRQHLALGAGLYHGSPTYGAEIELYLLRLAAATYTRELGDSPGSDRRNISVVSVSMGLTL